MAPITGTCGVAMTISLLAGLTPAHARESPRGVYCSCPPTHANSHSVVPAIAALPFVDGTLLRIGWNLVEPAPGVHDWSLLDAELDRAETYDTDVALAVVVGSVAPAWLAGEGVPFVDYEFFGEVRSIPAPWDPTFLEHWTGFIGALGTRYDDHPRVTLVHMTHSTHNGFEMQLVGDPAAWAAQGYTVEANVASWNTVVEAFADAFPNTPLDLEVHPVLGDDAVAEQVSAAARSLVGDRFGVFAAWWTQHNAIDVYPGMYDVLLDFARSTYATVQVARSETVHGPDVFGAGGLDGALDLALSSCITYVEIWNADLLNPRLQPTIVELSRRLDVGLAGDADRDGVVGIKDLRAVLGAWGRCAPATTCAGDVNCDGVADASDVTTVIAHWSPSG